MSSSHRGKIFTLPTVSETNPWRRALYSLLRGPLEHLLSLNRLNHAYHRVSRVDGPLSFLNEVLDILGVTTQIAEREAVRIPATGPLMVVANHPFGAIEGLILARLLLEVRSDVKIMANYLVDCIPELRDLFIPVDPFGHRSAKEKNVRGLREALRWIRNGKTVAVFPAGAVSHLHVRKRTVTDPPWSPTVARLIRKAECPVLPVYFQGCNSVFFQVMGLLHPRLRTVMLPHEVTNKGGKPITVRIGRTVSFEKLAPMKSDAWMMEYLRLKTYALGVRTAGADARFEDSSPRRRAHQGSGVPKPIGGPVEAGELVSEVDRLGCDRLLLESGAYQVFHAEAQRIPRLLQEIGRLREVTFREAGEGTGKAIDLDGFDRHYRHLFVWNRERRELVGAYRLGLTDHILQRFGKNGLYTSTLFTFKRPLLDLLNPALELGRSFVRPEYQRSYSPMLLLWKGIGHFVAQHPRYHLLFGPVSINSEYHALSRHLMMTFLRTHRSLPRLSRFVRAKNLRRIAPPLPWDSRRVCRALSDLEELAALISDIEATQTGLPILLKQYLKLGGRVLGFNVDPRFSNVLDALILVDLTQAKPEWLARYMGKEALARFHAYHGTLPATKDLARCA